MSGGTAPQQVQRYDLLFRIRKPVRYHDHRRSHFMLFETATKVDAETAEVSNSNCLNGVCLPIAAGNHAG